MSYSAEHIKVNKNPELKHISHDVWNQVWDIILQQPISQTVNLKDIAQELSYENFDFDVRIEVKDGKHLTVDVKFSRDPNPYIHDYSVIGMYKMFEDIEQLLGAIDTIQGEKIEDRWSPFRKKRK